MTGFDALRQIKGNGTWAIKFVEKDINGKEILFGIYEYKPENHELVTLGQTAFVFRKNNVIGIKRNDLMKEMTIVANFPYAFVDNKDEKTTLVSDNTMLFLFA